MDSVYEFEVRIGQINQIEWEVRERKVLGENDEYFVIDDHYFSTLQKKKERYGHHTVLEHVCVLDWTSHNFGEKFQLKLYSLNPSVKIAENKINRRFKDYCHEKCSAYLFGGNIHIDLKRENQKP